MIIYLQWISGQKYSWNSSWHGSNEWFELLTNSKCQKYSNLSIVPMKLLKVESTFFCIPMYNIARSRKNLNWYLQFEFCKLWNALVGLKMLQITNCKMNWKGKRVFFYGIPTLYSKVAISCNHRIFSSIVYH